MAAKERLALDRDNAHPLLPDGITVAYSMYNRTSSGLWSYCRLSLWRLSPPSHEAVKVRGLDYLSALDITTADHVKLRKPDSFEWTAKSHMSSTRGGYRPNKDVSGRYQELKWDRSGEVVFEADTGGESGIYFAIFPERGEVLRFASGD